LNVWSEENLTQWQRKASISTSEVQSSDDLSKKKNHATPTLVVNKIYADDTLLVSSNSHQEARCLRRQSFRFIAVVSTGRCLRTSANVTQVNELTAWKPLCKGREVMAHCTASNNQRSVWVWWQFALFCPCSRQPILFIRPTGVDFYGAGFVVGRRLRVRFQGIQYMSLSMKCAPSRQRGIHASAKEQTSVVDFHWWFYNIWIILLY